MPRDILKRASISGGAEPKNHHTAGCPERRLRGLKPYAVIAEVALIGLWALFVGRGYLNGDPLRVPYGSEFGAQSQSNHLWTQLLRCGWCAVWNGSEGGGTPALIDVRGSMLHPLVAFATLIWGVVNGTKVAMLISLWLAGVAQWWIAREFDLGAVARVWSAGIAVAGGHMASRMDIGNYQFLLATATASLVLAGLLYWRRRRDLRAVVVLAILLASFLLSGQGYLQVGLLGVSPAVLALVCSEGTNPREAIGQLLMASGLALLLAAPLLVPVIHFMPQFAKLTDPTFSSAQPLSYLPLNLVISDNQYYRSTVLAKFSAPALYGLYIGWIPLLLAFFGLGRLRKVDRANGWFLAAGILLAFFWASGIVFKLVVQYWPGASNIRFPSVIAGLAVPLVLGLTAYGIEEVLRLLQNSSKIFVSVGAAPGNPRWMIPLAWLLALPMIYSLHSVYEFSQVWYKTVPLDAKVLHLLAALRTDSLQWVEPPDSVYEFIEPAVAMGLKLSPGFMDVQWKGRPAPTPVLQASFAGQPQGTLGQVATVDGVAIYNTSANYAFLSTPNGQESCEASGSGGHIAVQCPDGGPARLTVMENAWSGWYAWLDGSPTPLVGDRWLEIAVPAGAHTAQFYYLPWDVPLGIALAVVGMILCIVLLGSGAIAFGSRAIQDAPRRARNLTSARRRPAGGGSS